MQTEHETNAMNFLHSAIIGVLDSVVIIGHSKILRVLRGVINYYENGDGKPEGE